MYKGNFIEEKTLDNIILFLKWCLNTIKYCVLHNINENNTLTDSFSISLEYYLYIS